MGWCGPEFVDLQSLIIGSCGQMTVLPVSWYYVGILPEKHETSQSNGFSRRVISCNKANSAYIYDTIPIPTFINPSRKYFKPFLLSADLKTKTKMCPYLIFIWVRQLTVKAQNKCIKNVQNTCMKAASQLTCFQVDFLKRGAEGWLGWQLRVLYFHRRDNNRYKSF